MNTKRKKISTKVLQLLLAKSAGYCQNPTCSTNLFIFFKNGTFVDIKEAAHIIANSPNGPRGEYDTNCDLEGEANIILLCPTCHTIIDKKPEAYPKETLLNWKKEHEDKRKNAFSENKVKNKDELVSKIKNLLDQNQVIFENHGPTLENESVILPGKEKIWKIQCVETIIPNNREIKELLQKNSQYLNDFEIIGKNEFILHQEIFELNHLTEDKIPNAPLFPKSFFDSLIGETKCQTQTQNIKKFQDRTPLNFLKKMLEGIKRLLMSIK